MEINFPKVKEIGSKAFSGCESLANVSLPEITTIGKESSWCCNSLETLYIPNVTSIGEKAFQYSEGSFGHADFSNLESIGENAFDGCTNLKTVSFPNVTTIGSYAFSDCAGLTDFEARNVTTIGTGSFNTGGATAMTIKLPAVPPKSDDLGNLTKVTPQFVDKDAKLLEGNALNEAILAYREDKGGRYANRECDCNTKRQYLYTVRHRLSGR